MLKRRIRQTFTLISLALLLGILALWARGEALVTRTVLFADARSHMLVHRGALQVDLTGLYCMMRDTRYARTMTLALEQFDRLPGELQDVASAAGPFSFRWMSRYTRRVPLQDLTDDQGKPIYVTQSVPLEVITVPAWLVALLLAIAPGRAFVRRLRQPRSNWLSPLRFVRRHTVAMFTLASICICIAWTLSLYRPAFVFNRPSNQSVSAYYARSADAAVAWMSKGDGYYWKPVGVAGVNIEATTNTNHAFIAPLELEGDRETGTAQLPYWLLFVVTATVPMTWLAMRIWGRQLIPGHCANCDYDLRYSTERCPECGRPIGAIQPRVSRRRTQAARFAAAAVLLLVTGTLIAAWAESRSGSSASLFYFGSRETKGIWLGFEDGVLRAYSGRVSATLSAGYPTRQFMSAPAWVPVFGLTVGTALLFWLARREGRIIPH